MSHPRAAAKKPRLCDTLHERLLGDRATLGERRRSVAGLLPEKFLGGSKIARQQRTGEKFLRHILCPTADFAGYSHTIKVFIRFKLSAQQTMFHSPSTFL